MFDASVIVFDVDDTLTQTARYIFQTLQHNMLAKGQYDPDLNEKLDILSSAVSPRTQIPFPLIEQQKLQERVWEEVISHPEYMLAVKPTTLFMRYFLERHPNLEGKTVALCTHRGWSPAAKHVTKLWYEKYRPVITVRNEHCHFLDSRNPEQTNKVDWLTKHYGDDFLLIDDNPLYDRSVIHEPHPNILIYDKYRKYDAYKNQRVLNVD